MTKAPMRTCVGCRGTFPKKDLLRIVRSADGRIEPDPSGRKNGRGTYLCRRKSCLDLAVRNHGIERALKSPLEEEALALIRREVEEHES